jgi:hypothetical protein
MLTSAAFSARWHDHDVDSDSDSYDPMLPSCGEFALSAGLQVNFLTFKLAEMKVFLKKLMVMIFS